MCFMKILSWNVNGIRANHRKGAWEQLIHESPDIFCIQETKAHPDQMPEEVRDPLGYFSYFDHSKIKKGYSGVALYTKIEPLHVEHGLGIKEFDDEGRTIIADFGDYIVATAYFPNGGRGQDRIDYKMRYYDAFLEKMNVLREKGKKIIFCGDVNTAHNEIDLSRPKQNEKKTGFLPIERAWIDELISNKYIDIWRHLSPDKAVYTWWDVKTRSRERNIGWRIDYFFISDDLVGNVTCATIETGVMGSDHCPISLEIEL
jgi:exodeoxyribonuclease III